jgi:hypothetical protein
MRTALWLLGLLGLLGALTRSTSTRSAAGQRNQGGLRSSSPLVPTVSVTWPANQGHGGASCAPWCASDGRGDQRRALRAAILSPGCLRTVWLSRSARQESRTSSLAREVR